MRLGVDFGTTHTVVTMVDRGNYPVVAFEGGDPYPSLAALLPDGGLRFGFDAAAVRHEPGVKAVRSFKRLLADAGPRAEIEVGGRPLLLLDLLTGFLSKVREDLLGRSNAGAGEGEPLEAAISVPANSSSAQRFLTLEAFRAAGFTPVALLNEPSAAGFEYAHRFRSTITSRREHVLVYDLGGGTFDASLLRMTGKTNEVVTSEGVRRLGGDDFDEAILAAVLAKAGAGEPDADARDLLLEECARQKEAVGPNTRKLVLDLSPLDLPPIALPIEDVWEACAPLVERTIGATEPVLSAAEVEEGELAGVYVVGGAGAFPLVGRRLRERFGEKRVKRSPHPFAATAVGLALFLDGEAGFSLADRLTRHFGVFREAEAGEEVVFDPIFPKDLPLPAPGGSPLTAVRRYRAAHDVGFFRFVECSRIVEGRPDGDVTPWQGVRFPFLPALRGRPLDGAPVRRLAEAGPEVEEVYTCGDGGAVEVTIRVPSDGFAATFRLGRPAL
jgi:molecular chaperone DnaK (HSP70)